MAGKTGEIEDDSKPNLHFSEFSLPNSFDSEIPGSSGSHSFPSEPPDIRNWFSSYVYESPSLDTGDDFKGFVAGESENGKCVKFEEIGREKEEDLGDFRNPRDRDVSVFGEKRFSNGFVECERFAGDNKEQNGSVINEGNHCANSNLIIAKDGEEDEGLEGKPAESHDLIPLKDDVNSCLNSGESLQKLEGNFSPEGDHGKSREELLKRKDCKENHLEEKYWTKEVDYISPKSNADSRRINGASLKNSLSQSNGEVEEGKVLTTNGFISTKKKKNTSENEENSWKRTSQENHAECVRNAELVVPVDVQVRVRRPLSERTNFQFEVADQEIAGKWRCPQKSKPDLGPPLKQLRLGCWLHRV